MTLAVTRSHRTELAVGMRPLLVADFLRCHTRLVCARQARVRKDTPANRAAVADVLGEIDAVLDLYLAALIGAQK